MKKDKHKKIENKFDAMLKKSQAKNMKGKFIDYFGLFIVGTILIISGILIKNITSLIMGLFLFIPSINHCKKWIPNISNLNKIWKIKRTIVYLLSFLILGFATWLSIYSKSL